MTVKVLKEVKADLIGLKKETEEGIDKLAHDYANLMIKAEFGLTKASEEEIEVTVAKLIAHGTILNKTKKAIEEEIEEVEEAIAFLETEEE